MSLLPYLLPSRWAKTGRTPTMVNIKVFADQEKNLLDLSLNTDSSRQHTGK